MKKELITYSGFIIIFTSIELFGNTDLFSWQMWVQIFMIVIGVRIITYSESNYDMNKNHDNNSTDQQTQER